MINVSSGVVGTRKFVDMGFVSGASRGKCRVRFTDYKLAKIRFKS